MSRRKQSNPKPIKVEEEEKDEPKIESNTIFDKATEETDEKKKNQRLIKANRQPQEGLDSNEDLNSPYECPVCEKILESQHDFTLHIRHHNSGENTDSHTCSLCHKTLSSASSLDRHMLVHSGERPFKCSRCNMAFTTNGNMHRHMRTHHGEGENTEDEKSVRTPVKRSISPNSEEEVSPNKKLLKEDLITEPEKEDCKLEKNDSAILDLSEASPENEEEHLNCPVCNKTFLCKYGLQTHHDAHPNIVLKCQDCTMTFRNLRRLSRHRYLVHIKKPNESSHQPTIGFQDLTFIDFSSEKFALIAKTVCEEKVRQPSSMFHMFECSQCKKAFPCGSALKMHWDSNHNEEALNFCPNCNSSFIDNKQLALHVVQHCTDELCYRDGEIDDVTQVLLSNKENFLAVLGLQSSNSLFSISRTPEEPYENPAYFTLGMPSSKNNSINRTSLSSVLSNDSEDFADIQSILSLTSAPSLLSSMGSSPVVVSSSSPRRGLVVNPDSPATADSATASPELPADVAEQTAILTSPSINGTNKGRYPCKLCPQTFPNLRALKGHNRTHLGMSPYRCNMCTYTSIDKSTLLRHLRTHNGERPYLCTICQYAFTTKANCERHMRKRHGKLTKQEIRSAMQHTPQSRDHSQTLNSFHCPDTVCKYCNVDFKFYRVLRHHLRSLHSSCNQKPFQCRICSMGFSTKNNCYRHVVKQHPDVKESLREAIWSYSTDNADVEEDGSNPPSEDLQETCSLSPGPPLLDPVLPISEGPASDSDLSSVEALLSWSNRTLAEVPLQEEPLDLAVHPVDLSLKKSVPSTVPTLFPAKELSKNSHSTSSHFSSPPPPPPPLVVHTSPFVCKGLNHFYNSPCKVSDESVSLSSNSSTCSPIASMKINGPPFKANLKSQEQCNVEAKNLVKVTTNNSNSNSSIISSSPITSNNNISTTNSNNNSIITLSSNNNSDNLLKKQKQKRYRTERPFKCNYCEAGFTLRSNMERHIKQQHPDHWAVRIRGRKPSTTNGITVRPLLPRSSDSLPRPISTQVKEAISQQIRQRKAVSVNEDENQTANGTSELTPTSSLSDSSGTEVKSEQLTETPEQAQDLVSVSRLLDTANAQKIQEIFRDSDGDVHQQSVGEKGDTKKSAYTNAPHRVSCPFCARRFPWTSSLRRHILTHTGQKPFKCPHCPLLFTTKSNCDRHLVRKHGDVAGDSDARSVPDRPYRCCLCPNSAFSTPSNLRKHLQQKHGQEDSKILWGDSLEGNMSVNSESDNNDAPEMSTPEDLEDSDSKAPSSVTSTLEDGISFFCSICNRSFNDEEHYTDHIQTEHSVDGDESVSDSLFAGETDERKPTSEIDSQDDEETSATVNITNDSAVIEETVPNTDENDETIVKL